jgi:predicted phosphoribosyltransferase
MSKFADLIDQCIKETIDEVLSRRELPDVEYIETDNLGEVIEKLSILHTRMWMLEDAIQEAKTDTEIADLKRKIDICFKVKRPRLVQAVNLLVDNAIATGRTLREDSVKLYKGVE